MSQPRIGSKYDGVQSDQGLGKLEKREFVTQMLGRYSQHGWL